MKEKIVYEAFDGFVFETPKECQEHEQNRSVLMFDYKGRIVDNINLADFLYLHDETSAEKLLGFVGNPTSIEGIAPKDTGLFMWEVEENKYIEVNIDRLEIVKMLVDRLF